MKLLALAVILSGLLQVACGTIYAVVTGGPHDRADQAAPEEVATECDAFARRHSPVPPGQGAISAVGSVGHSPNDVVISTAFRWRLKAQEAYQVTVKECMEQQGYHIDWQ